MWNWEIWKEVMIQIMILTGIGYTIIYLHVIAIYGIYRIIKAFKGKEKKELPEPVSKPKSWEKTESGMGDISQKTFTNQQTPLLDSHVALSRTEDKPEIKENEPVPWKKIRPIVGGIFQIETKSGKEPPSDIKEIQYYTPTLMSEEDIKECEGCSSQEVIKDE